MTKIVVFGSGGRAAGSAVLEARSRGHAVTAVTRQVADVSDPAAVAAVAAGHEVVIAGVYDHDRDPAEFFPATARALVDGLAEAGVDRLVWVGLASLLPNAAGVPLMDSGDYPQEYRSFFLAHQAALDIFREAGIDWVAISPSGDFDHEGTPVGAYRVAPGDAAARITYADHAIALVDEAERGEARRAHIGVISAG